MASESQAPSMGETHTEKVRVLLVLGARHLHRAESSWCLGEDQRERQGQSPWGVQGQLAKGEDLAPALRMQLWAQSTHLQFGRLLDTHIIGCSPHDHSRFACPAWKLHLLYHLEKGPRLTAGAAHNLFSTT